MDFIHTFKFWLIETVSTSQTIGLGDADDVSKISHRRLDANFDGVDDTKNENLVILLLVQRFMDS